MSHQLISDIDTRQAPLLNLAASEHFKMWASMTPRAAGGRKLASVVREHGMHACPAA